MAPPAVLGTATLFCRPLRFLFDVESSVSVLRNDTFASPSAHDVLGLVHVHISLSFPEDDPTYTGNTSDGYDAARPQRNELVDLIGRFARVRVRLQLSKEDDDQQDDDTARRKWRVQYQLSPSTESFLLPVDHTNVFSVLITDEFVSHITTKALQFNFLPPRRRDEEDDNTDSDKAPSVKTPRAAESTVPTMPVTTTFQPPMVTEETEATRRLAEAAANAAQSAAQAAREAARAATNAVEEAQSATRQLVSGRDAEAKALALMERDREQLRQLEQQREREREAFAAQEKARTSDAVAHAAAGEAKSQAAAALAALALEKQQYAHELARLSEEKQRICDDAERLARALDEKDAVMGSWQQQTATTDAAIELLKQRLAGDAKERDELQRRLRVLEEEKLELLRKSRACVLQ